MRHLILLLLIALILISGCEATKTWYNNSKFKRSEVIQETVEPICPDCPECPSELDAVMYYYDKDLYLGFEVFLENAGENLDCAFIRLDTDQFNDLLIAKHLELENVRILFDRTSTMDCESACVPYSWSQYNELYGHGMDLRVIKDLHETFCVSEDGIFITSSLLDDYEMYDHGLFLRSEAFQDIYQARFNRLWGGSE